mmetsp:Transcript_31553/g.69050  ORF Transcript_31553/g.69050 Transcript_31553/m.69050 type:complete len:241 (+) Transcript_31553:3-725(+)
MGPAVMASVADDFFSLPIDLSLFQSHFPSDELPWKWVSNIWQALNAVDLASLPCPMPREKLPAGLLVDDDVFIHNTVVLPAFGTIHGPAYIGGGCELRPGVFVRGNVIVGQRCVIGNSTELKNCMLLGNVQVPHFNYVGDSVLGCGAHFGAGVVTANVRLDRGPVPATLSDGNRADTTMMKLGAIVGEHVEVGCNAVLNPGCLLGKHSVVMPCVSFTGFLPPSSIASASAAVTVRPRKKG